MFKLKYIDYINSSFYFKLFDSNINFLKLVNDFGFKKCIIAIEDNVLEDSNLNIPKEISDDICSISCCLEIKTGDINKIHNLIKKYKSKFKYISVRSSDENIIRKVLDLKHINFLIPSIEYYVSKCNQTIAKIASKKDIIFIFEIEPLLKLRGYKRSKYISGILEMIPILRKYKVKFILTSNASSIYDFKDLYCMTAISKMIGFNDVECSVKYRSDLMQCLETNINSK